MPKATKPPKPTANGTAAPPEVLTLPEAAAFLRVPEAGLKADADAGRVPGRLVAGEWRFVKATLLAWLGEYESVPHKPEHSGRALERRIRKTGIGWNANSEREAEAFIAANAAARKATTVGD
jgi:hypothetical protein